MCQSSRLETDDISDYQSMVQLVISSQIINDVRRWEGWYSDLILQVSGTEDVWVNEMEFWLTEIIF